MRMSVGRFGAGLALVSLILGTGVGVGIEALGQAPAGAATTVTVNDPVDSGTLAPGIAPRRRRATARCARLSMPSIMGRTASPI